MNIQEAEALLRAELERPRVRTVGAVLGVMLKFYRDVRFEVLPPENHGDGLLLEWGTYDWGKGDRFELGLTRQFCIEGEDEPFQLRMVLSFEPTGRLRALSHATRWCFSLDDLAAFDESLRSSPPYRALSDREPEDLTIHFGQV